MRYFILSALTLILLNASGNANQPLRPDANGKVDIIFNPDSNEAQYGQWRSSKIGGGGYILSVVICPTNPDIVYAFSDVGGIFRTDDSGRNWRMIHNTVHPQSLDCVRGLTVDRLNPDIIIAAVGTQWEKQQGLYKSIDGGESWKLTLPCPVFGNGPNRSMGEILQRSPTDNNIIYAAPGVDGIFVSHDGGDSWTNLGHDKHYVYDIKLDRKNPDRIFLCTDQKNLSYKKDWNEKENVALAGGFYRSDDGGKTWNKLAETSPWELVQSPVDENRWYGIFDGMRIQYTDDNGQSWVDDSSGLDLADTQQKPNSGKSYKAIVAGPDFLVVGSGAGTFYLKKPLDEPWRKIDHNVTQGHWYARAKPEQWDHFGRACSSVVIDPKDPEHWYFTDWYSVYQSWDSGKNWVLTIDGIENTVILAVTQSSGDAATVHMGMADNGYFRSTDGADSFKYKLDTPDNCKAIAVAPSKPETVYGLFPDKFGWYANTLFTSVDGGQTFKRSPMKHMYMADNVRINSLCVDATDPRKVYIGASGKVEPRKGGVWVSTNCGGSWTWDSRGLAPGQSFFEDSIWGSGYQIARNRNCSMIAIKGNAVYCRNNDEEEWQKSSLENTGNNSRFVQSLTSPDKDGVFYIAEMNNGLLKSEDNGKNWKKILNDGIHFATIDQNNGKRIAVALDMARGLMLSIDGGLSWSALDNNIPQRKRLRMAFAGDRLVVGTPGNGVLYLPLTDAAKDPVKSKEIAPMQAVNIAPCGSCEDGINGWYKWAGKGCVEIKSMDKGIHTGKGLRIITSGEDIKASVSLPFSPEGEMTVSGYVICKTEQDSKVSLQYFNKSGEPAGWIDIEVFHNNGEVKSFAKTIKPPKNAYKANVVFVISSAGEIDVDEIRVMEHPNIFR